MSVDRLRNLGLSQLWWRDGNKGWRQRGGRGEAGRAGQGEQPPQFRRRRRTGAPKSDKTVIQTRFMCSAAGCERVEVGGRKVFQLSDPQPTKREIPTTPQGPGQVPPPLGGLPGPQQGCCFSPPRFCRELPEAETCFLPFLGLFYM